MESQVGTLRIDLLGPFAVSVGGRRVAPPPGKPRVVLAALAARPGRRVGVDELVDRVWGDAPTAAARTTIRGHVKRLRRLLHIPVLLSAPGGYRLDGTRVDVDIARFTDLATRAASDPRDERDLLTRALSLWRGPAFSDVDSDSLRAELAPPLDERRIQAQERSAALAIDAGRHREALVELSALVAEHPLHEPFWALLLRALHRSGRPADALARYDQCRRTLAASLGIDPSPELQTLHTELLAGGRV